jgi:UDP-glucose 4-epimerase
MPNNNNPHILITGGAGFIGSQLTDYFLNKKYAVTVFDNLSWGKEKFLEKNYSNPQFHFHKLDLLDTKKTLEYLPVDIDTVFHLAANSDIMRGGSDPSIDYQNTIQATFNLLTAMRHKKIKRIFYASGSGVYGEIGKVKVPETYGPLFPLSMYGATKLAAEGIIAAFVNLFDMQSWMIRPANIIGPRATHGVILDFITKLKENPKELEILGDGNQNKSYLYISDVLDAIDLIWKKEKSKISVYNLASDSTISVNKIAQSVIEGMGLKNVAIKHSKGDRGWKGDVPIIWLTNDKLNTLGWKAKYSSEEAVKKTIQDILLSLREG